MRPQARIPNLCVKDHNTQCESELPSSCNYFRDLVPLDEAGKGSFFPLGGAGKGSFFPSARSGNGLAKGFCINRRVSSCDFEGGTAFAPPQPARKSGPAIVNTPTQPRLPGSLTGCLLRAPAGRRGPTCHHPSRLTNHKSERARFLTYPIGLEWIVNRCSRDFFALAIVKRIRGGDGSASVLDSQKA